MRLPLSIGLRERSASWNETGSQRRTERSVTPNWTTGHGIVMLATPTPAYEGPKQHQENCNQARKWFSVPWIVDGVLVYVDDVDSHFDRARQAGAQILSEPEDGPPARRYRVEDIEGHRWMFMQRP